MTVDRSPSGGAGRGRALLALALATSLLAAGCVAPTPSPSHASPDAPPDPDSDVLGWEGGYWHNETLSITPGDGLNASEREAVITRSMARVEHLRGIEFDRDVPVSTESREAFRERFGGSGNGNGNDGDGDDAGADEVDPATALADATFEALFLVGESESGAARESATTAATVVGFYLPSDDRIVLVTETETPRVSETTLGHELVHALQFRNFETEYNTSTREGRNVRNAVVEGDASLIDYWYGQRCGDEWQCVSGNEGLDGPDDEGNGTGTGDGGDDGSDDDGGNGRDGSAADGDGEEQPRVHPGIAILNYFPYSDGPVFVREVYREGGWDAVEALYGEFPASTAQVITPERYGEPGPDPPRVPDRSTAAWERVRPSGAPYASVGMPGLAAMFAYTAYDDRNQSGVVSPFEFLEYDGEQALDPVNYNLSYAAGWDGDRLRAYRDGDRDGYVWRLSWSSPAEAREFVSGYRSLLAYWGGERVGDDTWRIEDSEFSDAFRVSVDGDTVTVVNAPSVEDLDDVHGPSSG